MLLPLVLVLLVGSVSVIIPLDIMEKLVARMCLVVLVGKELGDGSIDLCFALLCLYFLRIDGDGWARYPWLWLVYNPERQRAEISVMRASREEIEAV